MGMLELVSGIAVPAVVLIAAVIMLFPRLSGGDGTGIFAAGARRGFESAVSLLPMLVLLNMTVSLAEMLGVPSEILPLIMTRPVSGSASAAVFAALTTDLGADSFPALCAAVIMGSSDTLAYVTAVYFSSVGVRRTRHTYPAAVLVMILCIFLSCLLVRSFFAECGS